VQRGGAPSGALAAVKCVKRPKLLTRSHGRFLDLFVESVSACSNAGLSVGATATLNDPGKFVLLFAMLAGRLLPLVFLIIAIGGRRRGGDSENVLPDAKLAFG